MITDNRSINYRSRVATCSRWFLGPAAVLVVAQVCWAQQGILGVNLILNNGAEAGPGALSTANVVASIPSWTRTGNANVLSYNLPGSLLTSDPSPPDHAFQFFAGPATPANGTGANSTLVQNIDVSASASAIASGTVKFTATAFLGSVIVSPYISNGAAAQLAVAFKNAGGQTLASATVGPLPSAQPLRPAGAGISQQQQIGLVPAGTTNVTVTLTLTSFNGGYGAADSLSLVLNTLATSPGSVLGANLAVNGGAEVGAAAPVGITAPYIPGWSTAYGASVAPYGGTGWIGVSAPSPADRGVNLFCGGAVGAGIYQEIDVSAAASLIDTNQVTYEGSAWLGALAGYQAATLTYSFFDWMGRPLAPTVQLGGATVSITSLVETSHSDILPAGTRRIHLEVDFASANSLADDVAFRLAAPSGPPVITPGGIVTSSEFGGFPIIAPASWIEIYGVNLASTTQSWSTTDFTSGIAPTSLGGVSVSVGGKPAFVEYISPGQVNALVSSDTPLGATPVTVTNSNGTSDGFWLLADATSPGLLAPASFQVSGKQYVAALFSDNQTFVLPQGAIAGVQSRPAKPGETVTMYGVGFGPVSPAVLAGTLVPGQNSLTTLFQFLMGTAPTVVSYFGLVPSYTGLYQFNVVVPNVPANSALPISFTLGGSKTTQNLYIAVGN